MRACIVSRELAPFTGWGVGTYAANMARAMADAGHETHVLTAPAPGLGGADAERLFSGISVHTIDRSGPPASIPHVPCRATQGPLAIFQTLRALHERHAFDYIEFTDVYAEGYFAVQARRALGLFDRSVLAVRLHSPVFLLRRLNGQHGLDHDTACVEHMERATIRGVDLVLAPSRAILDAIADDSGAESSTEPRIRPPAMHVLPYPFDPELLSPQELATPAADVGRREVLFAGRLEYRKGVHLLVDAAQRVLAAGGDFGVRIIGVDTATAPGGRSIVEWLRSRVAPGFADRFTFEPNRPRAEVAGAMRRATVCCVPSLWENYPFTLLEAMSGGCCVIGAAAGGIPEIIRDGVDGLLFAAGDAGSLADGLGRALADAALRRRVGAAAPGRVASLCAPAPIVARLESLIGAVHASQNAARPAVASGRPGTAPVSVIIPFYNLHRYLPDGLASVQGQTVLPAEVIVVDDGSNDPEARALLARLEAIPPGEVRVIRQPNRGLSAARNAGIRAATSRWVLPLDADDILAPTFIERALGAAERNPDAVLITSWMSCFEGVLPEGATLLYVPIGFDRDLLCFGNVASSCTALLDRGAVLGAGGYDESLPAFEDWDLYCTLAERLSARDGPLGDRAAVIPETLIHNRVRADSMLRRMSPAARREVHAAILAKHPGLAADPVRVMRLLIPRSTDAPGAPLLPGPLRPLPARSFVTRLGRRIKGWSRG